MHHLFFILFLLLIEITFSQVCENDYTYDSLEQLDTTCTNFTGEVTISNASLIVLKGIRSIERLRIINVVDTHFSGIGDNLTHLGSFYIKGDEGNLRSLNGLENLKTVTGLMRFYRPWSLRNMGVLSSLTNVGSLELEGARHIPVIGIPYLTYIPGHFKIKGWAIDVENISFPILEEIGGDLEFDFTRHRIKDLNFLPSLRRIGGSLKISIGEPGLHDFDVFLEHIEYVGGDIYLGDPLCTPILRNFSKAFNQPIGCICEDSCDQFGDQCVCTDGVSLISDIVTVELALVNLTRSNTTIQFSESVTMRNSTVFIRNTQVLFDSLHLKDSVMNIGYPSGISIESQLDLSSSTIEVELSTENHDSITETGEELLIPASQVSGDVFGRIYVDGEESSNLELRSDPESGIYIYRVEELEVETIIIIISIISIALILGVIIFLIRWKIKEILILDEL